MCRAHANTRFHMDAFRRADYGHPHLPFLKNSVRMYPHHKETLDRITARLAADPDVLGVLLVGSIAHGLARPDSDVDIMVVVSDAQYAERQRQGTLTALDFEACTYEGGYIDIKYVSPSLMARVKAEGSEPARFAYDGASLVFSRNDSLAGLLGGIARYPVERKHDNLKRFFAQFKAWNWYCGEAAKNDNAYLLMLSITNLILFGGRLLLAENEVLYPSHKWFLKVLAGVDQKPEGLMALIDDLLAARDMAKVERLYDGIANFRQWPDASWSHQFMIDSELNWMAGRTPVADI